MKIFLDDVRNAPEGFTRVYDPFSCILLLEENKGNVEILSLDHDLGLFFGKEKEYTGYDVLLWLERNPQYMPKSICIHSANPVARKKMFQTIESIERRLEALV